MNNYQQISKNTPAYPDQFDAFLGQIAPENMYLSGNQDALKNQTLAIFCSKKCPGFMVIKSYQFICSLRHHDLTLISGFHSPMEHEYLRTLVGGQAKIIWSLAKSIDAFTLPKEFERLMDNDQLLLLSVFNKSANRITAATAQLRNLVSAVLADEIFIPYAQPKSKTEHFCKELLKMDKMVLTLGGEENQHIIDLGAVPIESTDIRSIWKS